MSLRNFVWDTEPSVREGLTGVYGTAYDEHGCLVKVFVAKGAIEAENHYAGRGYEKRSDS